MVVFDIGANAGIDTCWHPVVARRRSRSNRRQKAAELLAEHLALIELHPWSLKQLGQSEQVVFDLLDAAGWSCRLLEDNGNTKHYEVVPGAAEDPLGSRVRRSAK